MSDHNTFSDSDWDVLVSVPLAVLVLVGYADGGLAPAERRAFASIVSEMGTGSRSAHGPLVREVMGRLADDPGRTVERVDDQVGAGLPFYEVLAAARVLLDDLPRQADAVDFKEAMVHLAQGVARAWPVLGRRTSAEEARSIRFIGDKLGLGDRTAVGGGSAIGRTGAAA